MMYTELIFYVVISDLSLYPISIELTDSPIFSTINKFCVHKIICVCLHAFSLLKTLGHELLVATSVCYHPVLSKG